MSDNPAISLVPNQAMHIHNKNCIYCGKALSRSEDMTIEHVVGRKFVPTGTLEKSWNLIARACQTCNGLKSDLEDDISAISMQSDAAGQYVSDDPRLVADAQRKAMRSFSRRTRKFVKDSTETLRFQFGAEPGILFTFTLDSPPQADGDRIGRLARYHIGALFFLLTYRPETQTGRFHTGVFAVLEHVKRADWGNALMRWFMSETRTWDYKFVGEAADGFFKAAIRRASGEAAVWSWAVEWNLNYRVVGFMGDEAGIEAIIQGRPKLRAATVVNEPGRIVRWRAEEALPDEDDSLFVA